MRAVLFATTMEAEPFVAEMATHREKIELARDIHRFPGGSEQTDLLVAVVGMGKSAAEMGTRNTFEAYRPSSVVNIGIAGGLSDRVDVGHIYRVENAMDWQDGKGAVYSLNDAPFEQLPGVTLLTADKPVFDESLKRSMARHGDLVDMEGAVIAGCCAKANIPCVEIKGVSDTAGNGERKMLRENLARVSWQLARFAVPRLL